ncbi:MAG TPA: quinone-dependent dihydroorotate dehydrogenase [Candidatus Saccharibacteria bacterium]|jgi:dihydroorotate dehydrogenase (fumarate)|nr:quinone-dependent dihydroorotate dehydrogenase [Candidatus Saccharibacteria bacterium]
MYKKIIKPILFLFSPDFVHNSTVTAGRCIQSFAAGRWIITLLWRRNNQYLHQTILDIDFANPVGLSAGFDKNAELAPLMESVGFGFETAGSVTLEPRIGNPRPWFYRLPNTKSLVVHAGMANKGMTVISRSITRNAIKVKQMPLFLSVAVVARNSECNNLDAIRDTTDTVSYILERSLAKAIEINISCPNVGDNQPFATPEALEQLLAELDKIARELPFFVKMPNMSNMSEFDKLLQVIVRHDIQGVTVSNLVKDRETVDLKDALPPEIRGGLSGEPTKARSLKLIRHTYETYGDRLVIIGVGGIFSAQDAYNKMKAGASLVAMITGVIFEGPQVVGKINKGLVELARADGYSVISEAIGADCRKSQK